MCLSIAYDTTISIAKLVPTGMVSCCKLVQDNSLVLLEATDFAPALFMLHCPPPPLSPGLTPPLPCSVWARRIGFQNNIEPVF